MSTLSTRVRSLACLWFLMTGLLPTGAATPVYPGKTWAHLAPVEAGLDATRLEAFAAKVGGRGVIVRHGYQVFTWGDPARRGDLASAAKPIYSHFLFKALEAGLIADVDEVVVTYEPRLAGLNADWDHKDRNISWRHLAHQVSCYGVTENPGTAFDYSDWQMALFYDCLFLKAWKAGYDTVDREVFHPVLTDPLQCEDDPTMMAFGPGNRPGRTAMSPRDFARFGLLYLREGMWDGNRLLDAAWARRAVTHPLPLSLPRTRGEKTAMIPDQRSIGGGNNQTDHNGGYSWLWWINGTARDGERWWREAPADLYTALGHCGMRGLAVFPTQDIVVSWNDAQEIHCDRELGGAAFQLLADAVTGP